MSTYMLEQGESSSGKCDCCGKTTKTIWGFISQDESCRAVYYVSWTEGHRERGATFLICLGDWEDEDASDRLSFALRLRMMPSGAAFMVVDAAKTQWAKEKPVENDPLGLLLNRETALASPLKKDVFAIADLILDQDKRFQSFLKPPALPSFLKQKSMLRPPGNMKWN